MFETILKVPAALGQKVRALVQGHELARSIADELKESGAIAEITRSARRDVLASEKVRAEKLASERAAATPGTRERAALLTRAARLADKAGIPLAEAEEFLTQKED